MSTMKTLATLLSLLCLWVSPAWADFEKFSVKTLQNAAVATGNGAELPVDQYTSVGLDVAISATATVTFEVTANGTTYVSATCSSIADQNAALTNTATTSGVYQCNVAGMQLFRARISSYGSGTVTVLSRSSTAVTRRGGGGGGTLTNVTVFPSSPTVGSVVIVTDDSVVGACDSAAGVATTICRWNGSAWIKLGDGTAAGGALSSADIDTSAELAAILTDETGTGALVFGTGPTVTLANGTGLPISTGVSGLAANVATALATPSSANLIAAVTDETGTGSLVFGTAPTITLANGTALPISTGVSGLGANVATFLATPSSANLAAAVTGETGTGAAVFGTAPTVDSAILTTKFNPPSVTAFPGAPATGDTVIVTDDSVIGACDSSAGSARSLCRYNGTIWQSLGDGGAGGGIGGTVGTTDNAVPRADGTGGSTLQASGCTISDVNLLTCAGGFSSTGGTGIFTITEGTAPGAPAGAGEHNLYFDSTDSKFKSHENGGSVQTYARIADNLSAFAATTSTQLLGNISDETGSGLLVFGTTPTLTTPVISGAIAFPDGVTQTFNPNGTNAGLNVGSQAGALGTPNNGDVYYDSTANKYKCRENGVTVDCISTGAGSGDITDVAEGAGIDVTTPGGPSPTVIWDPSTFVVDVTLWNAANASRTLTANLSGATDPVITFSNSTVNVSTGTLQQGGVAVATADSTTTFTNKTMDAEGTGNVLTIPRRYWYPAAGCNNATAGPVWDLPAASPAVAACVTGTNTQKGVLDFADAVNLSAQLTHKLPSTWTGTVDATIKWFTAATTGDVVWQLATICVADAETDDPAFNTASTVTDTAKGTTLQTNDATITTVTVTGCAAGELMHLKIQRDSAHASDSLAATARLIGVELVMRETL